MENSKKVRLGDMTDQKQTNLGKETEKTKAEDNHQYSMHCDGCWWGAVGWKGSSSFNLTKEEVWGADTFKFDNTRTMKTNSRTQTDVESIWGTKSSWS
jgi:hypothetical protein